MAREMKDSGIEWLGSFPLEWERVPLWSLIKCRISGSWGDDPKNDNNDRACMRIADFDYDNLSFKKDLVPTMRNYSIDGIENKALSYGDLLIEKSGGGEKTPVGRAVVYRGKGNELFANFMDCIRFNAKIDVEFAKYIFASLYSRRYTNLYFNQTTGLQNFNTSRFIRETFLPLPCLIEQAHIASFLDSKCAEIDKAIEATKASIEEYKKLRQAIITEAVTKGLDPNAEMKDSGIKWIGKIPKHWNRTKIKNGCDLLSSGTTPASGHEEYYLNGTINWIQSGDLYNNPIISSVSKRITQKAFDNTPSLKVYTAPFIVVAMYGASVGNVSISEIDACCNQACCCIKTNEKMDLNFLMYWLISCKKDFLVKASGGGQPNISQQIIQNEVLLIPSKEEQHRIVSFLDAKCSEIDSLIKSKEKLIEELTAYRKALIYEYVTGKKEVPIESA